MIAALWIGTAAANGEPPGGPAAKDAGPEAQPKTAADKAQEDRDRSLNEVLAARDQADLTRASYERANKPGPVPTEAKEAFEQEVAAYAKAIDRPLASPEVIKVVAYCHLRLAGAYQYVQQFDKAIEQGKMAARVSAGTAQEVDATYAVGLIYLQAMHDRKQALTWFKRTQTLAQSILPDPSEQAKWQAATGDVIRQCEQEAEK